MEDEDSMDGLEAAETENTVETGKENTVSILSPCCFSLSLKTEHSYAGFLSVL